MFTKDEENTTNTLWAFARRRNIRNISKGLSRHPIIKEFLKIANENPDVSFRQIFDHLRKNCKVEDRTQINLSCIEKSDVDSPVVTSILTDLNVKPNYKLIKNLRPYLMMKSIRQLPAKEFPEQKRNFNPGKPFWVENRKAYNPDMEYGHKHEFDIDLLTPSDLIQIS